MVGLKKQGDAATRWSKKFDYRCIHLDMIPQREGPTDKNGKAISYFECYTCQYAINLFT